MFFKKKKKKVRLGHRRVDSELESNLRVAKDFIIFHHHDSLWDSQTAVIPPFLFHLFTHILVVLKQNSCGSAKILPVIHFEMPMFNSVQFIYIVSDYNKCQLKALP